MYAYMSKFCVCITFRMYLQYTLETHREISPMWMCVLGTHKNILNAHILNSLDYIHFFFFIYPLIDGCRCNNELHTLIPKRARFSSTLAYINETSNFYIAVCVSEREGARGMIKTSKMGMRK